MYFTEDEVIKAREMDLLTYLRIYEPFNLVRICGNTYCTKEHDSLKISNGKWNWFSRGIGGRSALDYLIKVKGLMFPEAVALLLGKNEVRPKSPSTCPRFKIPVISNDTGIVRAYLQNRCIDKDIVKYFIDKRMIFQDGKYGNAMFAGYDESGAMRYAAYRSTKGSARGEYKGSDKRFSFSFCENGSSGEVHLFESAIDLLSFLSLNKRNGTDWMKINTLSLGGVSSSESDDLSLPKALERYLLRHLETETIFIHFDNDEPGRAAAKCLAGKLNDRFLVHDEQPKFGKDVNDELVYVARRAQSEARKRSNREMSA